MRLAWVVNVLGRMQRRYPTRIFVTNPLWRTEKLLKRQH
jgi:hypothetical protein